MCSRSTEDGCRHARPPSVGDALARGARDPIAYGIPVQCDVTQSCWLEQPGGARSVVSHGRADVHGLGCGFLTSQCTESRCRPYRPRLRPRTPRSQRPRRLDCSNTRGRSRGTSRDRRGRRTAQACTAATIRDRHQDNATLHSRRRNQTSCHPSSNNPQGRRPLRRWQSRRPSARRPRRCRALRHRRRAHWRRRAVQRHLLPPGARRPIEEKRTKRTALLGATWVQASTSSAESYAVGRLPGRSARVVLRAAP